MSKEVYRSLAVGFNTAKASQESMCLVDKHSLFSSPSALVGCACPGVTWQSGALRHGMAWEGGKSASNGTAAMLFCNIPKQTLVELCGSLFPPRPTAKTQKRNVTKPTTVSHKLISFALGNFLIC